MIETPSAPQGPAAAAPSVPTRVEIRIAGRYWRVRWLGPFLVAGLVIVGVLAVATAKSFLASDAGRAFLVAYPCIPVFPAVPTGFPGFVRLAHFVNFLLMTLIVRSGLQILCDHPRLYTSVHSTPETEWLRFKGRVPQDRLYTAKDDTITVPGWLGIPGGRHTIGLARHWHFAADILFVLNGVVYVLLLLATGRWVRFAPTTPAIVPQALSCVAIYAAFQDPAALAGVNGFVRFDALQQLAYFGVVFLLAPLAIVTGLAMSPALDSRFRWYQQLFGNRQIARSLHFLVMCTFVTFIVVHVALVAYTGLVRNLNHVVLGTDDLRLLGTWLAIVGGMAVLGVNLLANPLTRRYPRVLQHLSGMTVSAVMGVLFDRHTPRAEYDRKDISPFFWPNGRLPTSAEWRGLAADGFGSYRLKVYGMVERPIELSLAEMKALGQKTQITMHHCIQGWSGIAAWGGLPLATLIDLVRPRPGVRYLMFYSFGEGGEGGEYYDGHTLEDARHPQSLLAYEMNFQPLPEVHGAPLRLRVENQLGFKQVKWIRAIEFIDDYRRRYAGEGGYNEDHEFFGYKAEI